MVSGRVSDDWCGAWGTGQGQRRDWRLNGCVVEPITDYRKTFLEWWCLNQGKGASGQCGNQLLAYREISVGKQCHVRFEGGCKKGS